MEKPHHQGLSVIHRSDGERVRTFFIPAVIGVFLLSSCVRNLGAHFESDGGVSPTLADNSFLWMVTHELSPNASPYEGELTWDDFDPVADGPIYPVQFSANGQVVTIYGDDGEAGYVGELEASTVSSWRFHLVHGTFAGGHFLAWVEAGELEAELTLYGSGLPVLRSQRGRLVAE